MDDQMKAITVCEPYASLIALRHKRVENRSWPTHYRGWLAIHAGRSKKWLTDAYDHIIPPDKLVFGAIVGVVWLRACVHIDALEAYTEQHPEQSWLHEHQHVGGPWLWILDRHFRLSEPVQAKGAQGLWNLSRSVLRPARLIKVA